MTAAAIDSGRPGAEPAHKVARTRERTLTRVHDGPRPGRVVRQHPRLGQRQGQVLHDQVVDVGRYPPALVLHRRGDRGIKRNVAR